MILNSLISSAVPISQKIFSSNRLHILIPEKGIMVCMLVCSLSLRWWWMNVSSVTSPLSTLESSTSAFRQSSPAPKPCCNTWSFHPLMAVWTWDRVHLPPCLFNHLRSVFWKAWNSESRWDHLTLSNTESTHVLSWAVNSPECSWSSPPYQ